MKAAKKTNNWFLATSLFGLVFFGFYFVFSSLSGPEQDSDYVTGVEIKALNKRVDNSLNRSLREAYNRKQMRDFDISARNDELSSKFKYKQQQWRPKPEETVDIFDEDLSENEVSLSSLSMEDQLRVKMDQEEQSLERAAREKAEYIRRYKENAKNDGWIVELNDNLEVVSARPASN